MRHLKTFGLAVAAALALMAFIGAGTAPATLLCKSKVTPCNANKMGFGETLHSVAVTKVEFNIGAQLVKCEESTKTASITNSGGESKTVTANITELSFSKCGTCNVNVLANGSLEYHWKAGTHDGTETGKGTELTFSCSGIHCVYGVGNGTEMGPVTGSTTTGAKAKTHTSPFLTKLSGSSFCANTSFWLGTYEIQTPSVLDVMDS